VDQTPDNHLNLIRDLLQHGSHDPTTVVREANESPEFAHPATNPYYYEKCFPDLFPYGTGGPGDAQTYSVDTSRAATEEDDDAGDTTGGGDGLMVAADGSGPVPAVDNADREYAHKQKLESSYIRSSLLRGGDRRWQRCPYYYYTAYHHHMTRQVGGVALRAARGDSTDNAARDDREAESDRAGPSTENQNADTREPRTSQPQPVTAEAEDITAGELRAALTALCEHGEGDEDTCV